MARPRLTEQPSRPTGPLSALGVFAGGLIGGAARLAIDAAIEPSREGIPLDIVVINIVGAFGLGVLTGWVSRHGQRPWVPFAGTGALGTFTTFSALAALPWITSASAVLAIGIVLITLIGAIAAAAAGWKLSSQWQPRDTGKPGSGP